MENSPHVWPENRWHSWHFPKTTTQCSAATFDKINKHHSQIFLISHYKLILLTVKLMYANMYTKILIWASKTVIIKRCASFWCYTDTQQIALHMFPGNLSGFNSAIRFSKCLVWHWIVATESWGRISVQTNEFLTSCFFSDSFLPDVHRRTDPSSQHSPEVTRFNDFIWDSFWLEVNWRDYLVTVFVTLALSLTCSCGSFGHFSLHTVTVLKTETFKGRLWCFCLCFIPNVTAHLACCSCTPPAGWNWTRPPPETTHNRYLWSKLNTLLCDNFQQFDLKIKVNLRRVIFTVHCFTVKNFTLKAERNSFQTFWKIFILFLTESSMVTLLA